MIPFFTNCRQNLQIECTVVASGLKDKQLSEKGRKRTDYQLKFLRELLEWSIKSLTNREIADVSYTQEGKQIAQSLRQGQTWHDYLGSAVVKLKLSIDNSGVSE